MKMFIHHPPISNPPISSPLKFVSQSGCVFWWISHVPPSLPKASVLGQGQRHVSFLRSPSVTAVMTSLEFCPGLGTSLRILLALGHFLRPNNWADVLCRCPAPTFGGGNDCPEHQEVTPRTLKSEFSNFEYKFAPGLANQPKPIWALEQSPDTSLWELGDCRSMCPALRSREQTAWRVLQCETWLQSFGAGKVQCFIQISSKPWN